MAGCAQAGMDGAWGACLGCLCALGGVPLGSPPSGWSRSLSWVPPVTRLPGPRRQPPPPPATPLRALWEMSVLKPCVTGRMFSAVLGPLLGL